MEHPRLLICRGSRMGEVIEVTHYPLVIGRGAHADIVIEDCSGRPTLSRMHLLLRDEMEDGSMLVRDVSTNGTRLGFRMLTNGQEAIWSQGEMAWLGPDVAIRLVQSVKESSTSTLKKWTAWAKGIMSRTITGRGEHHRLRPVRLESLADSTLLGDAWRHVALNRGASGVDGVRIEDFAEAEEANLQSLCSALSSGRYRPLPPRAVMVSKRAGGYRRIVIFTVSDRIILQALMVLLRPILEAEFSSISFAYRLDRSAHDALRSLDGSLRERRWVVDADIESFFDSVDHRRLLAMLRSRVEDSRIVDLLGRYLAEGQSAPGRGIAQGAATSPLLANLYLTPFDRHLTEKGYCLVRYADDFVVACADKSEAERALLETERFLRCELDLRLRSDKTRIVTLEKGFTFLGFRFTGEGRRPDSSAVSNLEEKMKELSQYDPVRAGKVLRGWMNYFQSGLGEAEAISMDSLPAYEASAPASLEEELPVSEQILELFRGRTDCYAVQWATPEGRKGYLPRRSELTSTEIERHLSGEETLGVFLSGEDGKVSFLVIDVDSPRADEANQPAIDLTWELHRQARLAGIPAYVEDSGQKGRHLWIFFSSPVRSNDARAIGRLLLARAGGPVRGATCEIFPRCEEQGTLGSMIKLPFGINKCTGRRCLFIRDEGEPFDDVSSFLRLAKRIEPSKVGLLLKRLAEPQKAANPGGPPHERDSTARHTSEKRRPEKPKPATGEEVTAPADDYASGAVEKLLEQCSLIRSVVDRAAEAHHLAHVERLILLYTMGRLGEEGRRLVHVTMASCDNYKPAVTQKWLDRLEPDHAPLSCARIQDWLSELYSDVFCSCTSAGERSPRSPVDIVGCKGRKRQRCGPPREDVEAEPLDPEEWSNIVEDMFAHEPNEDLA